MTKKWLRGKPRGLSQSRFLVTFEWLCNSPGFWGSWGTARITRLGGVGLKVKGDEGGQLNVVVFPRAELPLAGGIPRPTPPPAGPREYHDPPPLTSKSLPDPDWGGRGSWYSRGAREHLPVGIPHPALFPFVSDLTLNPHQKKKKLKTGKVNRGDALHLTRDRPKQKNN